MFGKSYGAKKYVIKQFLKNRSQFIYLRRYDNELKAVFEKSGTNNKDFFDDIKNDFPKLELKAKNRKFYLNGECFGFAKRMTEAQDLKSATYENVKTIIIDEYPIEKNKRYYLPNERNDFNAVFLIVLFVTVQTLKFLFWVMQLKALNIVHFFHFLT